MQTNIIWARESTGGIGYKGDLPWKLGTQKADMRRFVELTQRHPVIMGRKTYESIPPKCRPLIDRHNIVLTKNKSLELEGATCALSLEAALQYCLSLSKENNNNPSDRRMQAYYDYSKVFIIGGYSVYADALEINNKELQVDNIYITDIKYKADKIDTYSPDIPNDFVVKSYERFPKDIDNIYPYTFLRMVRKETLDPNIPIGEP